MKPNVGMVYPVCAPVATYTPGTSITYSAGSVVSEARGATVNWDRADGEFYGDDILLDSDNGVLGYTIDFEPAGLSDAIRKTLLGETQSTSEYSITDGGELNEYRAAMICDKVKATPDVFPRAYAKIIKGVK